MTRLSGRTSGPTSRAVCSVLASYQGQRAATIETDLELNIAATRALTELPLWRRKRKSNEFRPECKNRDAFSDL